MTKLFYDVFICHTYEDKTQFANKLALALKTEGFKVWYSGFELVLGTPITASIKQALRESKCSIVIISPVYLRKKWIMKELDLLFSQEKDRNRILPVLHKTGIDEIRKQLPMLAGGYSISSKRGIQYVVNRAQELIRKKDKMILNEGKQEKNKKITGPTKKINKEIQNTGLIVLGDAQILKDHAARS